MTTKKNDSIKKVQNLDWDDSMGRKSTRRGYIVEKWFEIQQEIKKEDYSSKFETS